MPQVLDRARNGVDTQQMYGSLDAIKAASRAGLRVETVRDNPYRCLSPRALAAADEYGVTSVTVLATKPQTA